MVRILSLVLALSLVPVVHAQRPGQPAMKGGHCCNTTAMTQPKVPFTPNQFAPPASPPGGQITFSLRPPTPQFSRPPLLPGYPNPLMPGYPQPLNPLAPTTPVWQNPLAQPQTPTNPLAPTSLSLAKQNPLPRAEPRPISADSFLQRTDDEKTKYVRDALKRGWDAEQAGNKLLARACYENAANTYPDVELSARARSALERLAGK